MNAIEFDAATLVIANRTVLQRVSFTVAPGEFIGVLGPNGAGKTTVMRAVLGLLRPASGTIRVMGAAPSRGDARLGYVPQQRSKVAPRLSGFDFVGSAAGGERLGLPYLDRATRTDVAHALDLVGAGALAARPLGELSGGERQRLLLAQALLGKPQLLLLDEPLLSLDPRHQAGVVALVRELQQRLGITVLFSAHDLNPLLGALDRVLYLGAGQAALGSLAEVVTPAVLSRLYGTPMQVVPVGRRLFVVAAEATGPEPLP